MKLGIATSVLCQYELKDAVSLIARAGFDGVDIWGGRPHVYRRDHSLDELKNLRKLIANHGLVVSSFMPAFYRYPYSLSNPNPKVRLDSIQYMRECLENAAALGAKIVLVVPDLSLIGQSKKDSLNRFIDSIDKITAQAMHYDLQLGIEILYPDESNLVNTSDDALDIIKTLDFPNIGVVVDTGTLNLSKEKPEGILRKLGGYLLQIHIDDNEGKERQQNLIPGDGTFDFLGFVRALKQCEYSGFLSAELSREFSNDPEPALRRTVERLRGWIQTA